MLWSPVAFALGAAAYLALKSEPSWSLLALVALALGVLAVWSRSWTRWSGLAVPLTLMAFAAAGALAGKVRCDRVAAPVMPAERGVRVIDGFVVDVVSPGAAGPRLLIAPVSISRLAPENTPTRIRVSLPEGMEAPPPGSQLRLRAMLSAPPPPAAPGSHDFARDAWFNGIGGVGFTVGEIEETTLDPPPWRLRLAMAINAMRWSLASRIVERLGPDSGGIAAAMVTGHEAWITAEQTEAMRASGLAHILSISGLHMAIVGGFVFAAVRLLVAAWPWAALRFPGKKVAAIAGLAAVGAYLVVSGAPPPAVRAAITAGVAFLAILADRQAVTLHGLALAALIILIAQPEQAGAAGFQMSFAATAALVALAEAWPRLPREISVPWPIRFTQGAMAWLAISVGASFVAGLATGPFSMQHFNRLAIWGLPANLVVSPLSSFVIMPFLAVGAALEPLGLGGPFLAVAGWGIDAMTAVARWFASAHGAQHTVASAPAFTLVLSFLGIMLLCLWKGRLRWLGVPLFMAVSLLAAPDAARPLDQRRRRHGGRQAGRGSCAAAPRRSPLRSRALGAEKGPRASRRRRLRLRPHLLSAGKCRSRRRQPVLDPSRTRLRGVAEPLCGRGVGDPARITSRRPAGRLSGRRRAGGRGFRRRRRGRTLAARGRLVDRLDDAWPGPATLDDDC